MRLRRPLSIAILLLGDVLAVGAGYVIAYLLRNFLFSGVLHIVPESLPFDAIGDKFYVLAVYPLVFAYEGLYTKRLMSWEVTRRYLRGVTVATAVVMILLFFWRFWIVSRLAVVLAWAVCSLLAPAVRMLARRLLVATRIGAQPVIILGSGASADQLERELRNHSSIGYEVVRRIDDQPAAVDDLSDTPAGAVLIIVSSSFRSDQLATMFQFAERRFAEVLVVPGEILLRSSATDIEQLGSVLVVKYRHNLLRPTSRYVKRAAELLLATLLVVVLLPGLVLLSLLVRLSSSGPVLFRQQRIGRSGRAFSCFKFRTMYVDAEQRLESMLRTDERVRREYDRYARITDDPRVTPIGRLLRRTSLDELPQIWNVLRGDMALIGPRPYLPSEAGKVGDLLDTIVRVRPGMTGLWQVSGRAELPFRDRTLLDEYYIRNWSLWMDVSIVLRTPMAVLSARGAY
jgi:undecaprenyl-phosphate galactose phosphotransferase